MKAEGDVVTGETSDFYSVIPDFETDLRLCYLVIRHKKLINSTIEAFANFFPKPKHRERIYIGYGKGETKTYTLGLNGSPDAQINPSTLRIYVDGNATHKQLIDSLPPVVRKVKEAGFYVLNNTDI